MLVDARGRRLAVAGAQGIENLVGDRRLPVLVSGDGAARLDRVPDVAEDRQQIAIFGRKLAVQPLAHPAGKGRAAPVSRNAELEITAPHNGNGEEIAIRDVVDRLRQNARRPRFGNYPGIQRTIVSGGDGKVGPLEVAPPLRPLVKRYLTLGRERRDTRSNLRADHRHDGAREEQGVELAVGDLTPADDQAGLSI